jgi:hypothetical protein
VWVALKMMKLSEKKLGRAIIVCDENVAVDFEFKRMMAEIVETTIGILMRLVAV